MLCPNCQFSAASNSNFCPACGTKMIQSISFSCHQCNTVIPSSSNFCPHCGAKV
ncbi:zinc-ribbon domain-containing protein [Lacrimispora sp.]|uniref:zinc-ribbon domain-containing protein n=1 Tax=Lacrimispora sp. TaxID=2719234 RepID=UPI0034616D9D